MIDIIKPLIKQFMPFAQERMGFQDPPRLFVRRDEQNAQNPLGKTAYYDPQAKAVTLYISGRHPKDVMRSLSHELVHHVQNCNGEFDNVGPMGDGYAQNDSHLREMERQAYEIGNLCFRDWEDSIKQTIYFEHLQKGVEKVMSTKDWKNGELKSLLSEAWGFKMDLSKLNEDTGGAGGELTDEEAKEEDEGLAPVTKREEDGTLEERWADETKAQADARKRKEKEANTQKCMEDMKCAPMDMECAAHCGASLEEAKELYEMGGCADHGAEDEVVVMQSAGDEGPSDPNALVDELSDVVARLQAALGGMGGEADAGEEMTLDIQERFKKALKKALKEGGAKEDDESKTHPGEEDYTWKKGEDSKTDSGTHDDGSRKGDDSETHSGKDYEKHHAHHDVHDDSEKEHYEENAMSDDEHLKAIRHHLHALMKDRDYDDEKEEELDERRGRGRNDPRIQRGTPDSRARPMEEAIRKAIRASLVKKTK